MATAKFVDTTAKLVDEGVDLGKILYQVSRAPYDSRVPVGDLGFTKLYAPGAYCNIILISFSYSVSEYL